MYSLKIAKGWVCVCEHFVRGPPKKVQAPVCMFLRVEVGGRERRGRFRVFDKFSEGYMIP